MAWGQLAIQPASPSALWWQAVPRGSRQRGSASLTSQCCASRPASQCCRRRLAGRGPRRSTWGATRLTSAPSSSRSYPATRSSSPNPRRPLRPSASSGQPVRHCQRRSAATWASQCWGRPRQGPATTTPGRSRSGRGISPPGCGGAATGARDSGPKQSGNSKRAAAASRAGPSAWRGSSKGRLRCTGPGGWPGDAVASRAASANWMITPSAIAARPEPSACPSQRTLDARKHS